MDRQMAIVLLDQPTGVDMQAVARTVKARYPALPVEAIAASGQNAQGAAQSPLITVGGENIAVMNMPAPLPQVSGNGVWARAAMIWPQVPSVRAEHRAHIIVATVGHIAPLREARLVTAVVGGVLDAVRGCSAVMWAERAVRPASRWKDESRAAYADYPNYPILLWIDLAPAKTAAGIIVVTVGLSTFIGREIEFEAGRLDLGSVLAKVAGLACYLIEHGNVIKDGHTFGGSKGERLMVRHAASGRLSRMPILRVAPEE
jgi:hypothetical protein